MSRGHTWACRRSEQRPDTGWNAAAVEQEPGRGPPGRARRGQVPGGEPSAPIRPLTRPARWFISHTRSKHLLCVVRDSTGPHLRTALVSRPQEPRTAVGIRRAGGRLPPQGAAAPPWAERSLNLKLFPPRRDLIWASSGPAFPLLGSGRLGVRGRLQGLRRCPWCWGAGKRGGVCPGALGRPGHDGAGPGRLKP